MRSWLVLSILLGARAALAFDTAEHAVYERRALRALSAGPRGAELDELQNALRDLLGRPICGTDESNLHCIEIPELTALAGDYSSTPDNLLFRFFEPTARDQQIRGWLIKPMEAFKAFATTRTADYKKGRGIGEMVRTRPLSLKSAQQILERDQQAHIEGGKREGLVTALTMCVKARLREPGFVAALEGLNQYDASFLALAATNANHFRNPAGGDELTAWTSRYRTDSSGSRPANHALAMYSDLHAAAMSFLAESKLPEVEDGHAWALRGTALFFELFAQHYLQDSISVGHIHASADAAEISRFVVNGKFRAAWHNRNCASGADVALPEALCKSKLLGGFADLSKACSEEKPVVLHGDDVSICGMEHGSAGAGVTAEWAVLLSEESMLEVLDAQPPVLPRGLSRCADDQLKDEKMLSRCDLRSDFKYSGARRRKAFACVCTWWTMSGAARAVPDWDGEPSSRDRFTALQMLPNLSAGTDANRGTQ